MHLFRKSPFLERFRCITGTEFSLFLKKSLRDWDFGDVCRSRREGQTGGDYQIFEFSAVPAGKGKLEEIIKSSNFLPFPQGGQTGEDVHQDIFDL
jgi:hypothetical protein